MDLPQRHQPLAGGNAHRQREVEAFFSVERAEHGECRCGGDQLVLAHQVGGHLEDPAAVIDLRVGPIDPYQVLRLVPQLPGLGGQGFLGLLLRGQELASGVAGWLGRLVGELLIAVGGGGGLQLGNIDRDAVGTVVFPGFPRLGRGEVGASDLQGLVASPVVVVLPVADQELGELLKVLRAWASRNRVRVW